MTSNAAVVVACDQQDSDDPMKQTMMIMKNKIRNLEKRKLKLEGYLLQQYKGEQLSEDQLLAASKYNEVVATLDFAKNLKKQLSSLLITVKQKKRDTSGENHTSKVDNKVKDVLMFQNILDNIKDENVKQDLLTGDNGAVQLSEDEISRLTHFSKMVTPKRRVKDGKALFEYQLKTSSKHYMKLIDGKPNMVAGTSYADIKECLLKIEKSGYLDYGIRNLDKEVKLTNQVSSSETPLEPQQPDNVVCDVSDNIPISSDPSAEDTENKLETIYFTNNNISENVVEQKTPQNRNISDSAFNTSFDFLQDSQLEEDNIDIKSKRTKTFSSSLLINSGPPMDDAILKILSTPPKPKTVGPGSFKETKLDHLENTVGLSYSNSSVKQLKVSGKNRTEAGYSNKSSTEDWSVNQTIPNNTDNDWVMKHNWVQMAEADKQEQPTTKKQSRQQQKSNFGLVTNGESNEDYQQGNSYVYKNRSYKNSRNQYNDSANTNNSRISRH